MNDDSQVAIHPDRPKIVVLGAVDAMETEPGIRRAHLKVENSGFRGLLLLGGQLGETAGEGVGDAEVHGGRSGKLEVVDQVSCESGAALPEFDKGVELGFVPLSSDLRYALNDLCRI